MQVLGLILLLLLPSLKQVPRMPDVAAQRAAMKKLGFLAGEWSGSGRIYRAGAEPVELIQTERAQYKLDGLLLEIEGVGRTKSDSKPALQALGIVSYDDEQRTYRFRAFNDGRWLECDVKLLEDGEGMSWGFSVGDIRTSSVLRIAGNGNWTEEHEITVGSQPPRKFMEVNVARNNARDGH